MLFRSLAESQEGIATELIEHELSKKDDGCHKWFKENNLTGFFVELTDSVQNAVSDIL